MNNDDLKEELKGILLQVVSKWSHTGASEEPLQSRMARALLELNAFEADYRRVLQGEDPIRTDYPIPLPIHSANGT